MRVGPAALGRCRRGVRSTTAFNVTGAGTGIVSNIFRMNSGVFCSCATGDHTAGAPQCILKRQSDVHFNLPICDDSACKEGSSQQLKTRLGYFAYRLYCLHLIFTIQLGEPILVHVFSFTTSPRFALAR